MYDGAEAPTPDNYNAPGEDKHWIARMQSEIINATDIHIKYQKRLRTLKTVDDHIGQIVDLLEKKGEFDNTYIIYTSDNGYQLGQHRFTGDKRQMYEHDLRVPFVVVGPGVPKGIETDRVVMNVDIAPSIYELVTGNSDPHPSMDGVSFVPYLKSLQESLVTGGGEGKIEDPHARQDFLVSYYGEGQPECGVYIPSCSSPLPSSSNWHIGDALNNTFHCLRVLNTGDHQPSCLAALEDKDFVYCKFDDDEHFVEYYNHTVDPFQLTNRANDLSEAEREWLDSRLEYLRSCQGTNCNQ